VQLQEEKGTLLQSTGEHYDNNCTLLAKRKIMYYERRLELISSASKGNQYTVAASLIAIVRYKENEVPILSWFVFFAVHL
jgi:hypothetical protein